MYLSEKTIKEAIAGLRGTADHFLKIWFVLKAMGLSEDAPVRIDTSNSTPYLKALFSCGASDGSFYIPFSNTRRFSFMKHDASRSIIQTTLQRWATSGSVVTCDPSAFLYITDGEDGRLIVKTGRQYPLGLGNGKNGFALADGQRVCIPAAYFAIWMFSRCEIGQKGQAELVQDMVRTLHLSPAEFQLIFIEKDVTIEYQDEAISDEALFELCRHAFDEAPAVEEVVESTENYIRRVNNMVTISEAPAWVQTAPETQLKRLLESGEKTILLYGAPRTGKTRAIDRIVGRGDARRVSIQMHEGWGYENLVLGMFPDRETGRFAWKAGELLAALRAGKKYIVLEEINRTHISQALGELFSLLESAYRGEQNAILLPNGESVFIPEDVVIFMTMNTIDAGTEDIDDALVGRMASVHFPPRVEDLGSILAANGIDAETAEKVKEVFHAIGAHYPLGHGYFANFKAGTDFRLYYLSRIRPVLSNHFNEFKPEVIAQIDNAVDSLF